MSRNYIPELSEILGVDIGEKFKISQLEGYYQFDECELLQYSINNNTWVSTPNLYLIKIIKGDYTIEKAKFYLKFGEKYYYIDHYGCVRETTWIFDIQDIAFYLMKNCFRSVTEALRYKNEIVSKCKNLVDNMNK